MARSELGADAYRRLREGIIAGRFQPNERLVEANLSKTLGAGRTAVRAALVRLDQEGLVTREHNRGARVRLVSDQEALQIEEVRAALERLLARQAAAKATASDVRELRRVLVDMRKCFANGDAIGYSELNPRFHQLIWAAARNPIAGQMVGTLKSQSLRFQYQTMLRDGRNDPCASTSWSSAPSSPTTPRPRMRQCETTSKRSSKRCVGRSATRAARRSGCPIEEPYPVAVAWSSLTA